MKFLKIFSLTLFIHSFAGWIYIAQIAIIHPDTLPLGLTHFAPWPREDTFGIFCFILSFISFFIWYSLKDNH